MPPNEPIRTLDEQDREHRDRRQRLPETLCFLVLTTTKVEAKDCPPSATIASGLALPREKRSS